MKNGNNLNYCYLNLLYNLDNNNNISIVVCNRIMALIMDNRILAFDNNCYRSELQMHEDTHDSFKER